MQILEPQPAVFVFHNNHGRRIVLSDNQLTAEWTGPEDIYWDGLVMSRDPMQVNKLYEVKTVRDGS